MSAPFNPSRLRWYLALIAATSMSLPAANDEFRMAKLARPIEQSISLKLDLAQKGFVLPDQPSMTSPALVGSAACVWNEAGAGADVWTNPLKWDNCAGGSGPGPGPVGTPGEFDSAQIDAGTVTLDVAVTVSTLILNGGTVTGDQNMTVVDTFNWTGGTLGASGSTYSLTASGASLWFDAGSADQRMLSHRDFINLGSLTVAANISPTLLANNARMINSAGATAVFSQSGGTGSFTSNGVGTPEILNQGTLDVASGQWQVDAKFTNTGSVNLTGGAALELRGPGIDTGSYAVGEGSSLRIIGAGAVRTLTGSGSLTGAGVLGVDVGGQLAVTAPTYTIFQTSLDNHGASVLDLSTGGLVTLPRLLMLGGVVTGTSAISVTEYFDARAGTVATTAAGLTPFKVVGAGQAVFLNSTSKVFRQRAVEIAGASTSFWNDGNIQLELGSTLTVGIGSAFQLSRDDSIICPAVCTSSIVNNGTIEKPQNFSPGASVSIDQAITFTQAGNLVVFSGTFNVPPITQIAGQTFLSFTTDLNLAGADFTINGGILTGTGNVTGHLKLLGGLLRPGSPASSVAFFNVTGDYTQGVGGTLEISTDDGGVYPRAEGRNKSEAPQSPLGGGNMDRLFISGTATLNGLLDLVNGGGNPIPPRTFLTAAGGVSGVFATYTSDYPALLLDYDATSVFLVLAPPVENPVVTSVADPGDGICDVSECTLREAIHAANATSAADAITFNIPVAQCVGAGSVCIIEPLTLLPNITSNLTIDGYTQPGAIANTQAPSTGLGTNAQIRIELDGSTAGGAGLVVRAPGATVLVEGLAINDFQVGMEIAEEAQALMLSNGVTVSGQTNSIDYSDDWDDYVAVLPAGATNLSVITTGSGDVDLYVRFGAPPSFNEHDCASYEISGDEICEFPAPPGGAVYIRVDGYEPGLIDYTVTASWTGGPGVESNFTVGGMFFGVHPDGSAATGGQATGIEVSGGTLQLGDGSARRMNVISANASAGVRLSSANAGSALTIQGNLIGTGPDGASARGNGGPGIQAFTTSELPGVTVGGTTPDQANVIGHNIQEGISLTCTGVLPGTCFNGMLIAGNFIGTNVNGVGLGNLDDGIRINEMPSGTVTIGGTTPAGANVISNNAGAGISNGFDPMGGPLGKVSILINRTRNNDGLGVDVFGDGRSPNDLPDIDRIQNFPEFSAYTLGTGGSTANLQFVITTAAGDGTFPMRVDFYKGHLDELGVWLGSSSCGGPPPGVARGTACTADLTFPAGTVLTSDDSVVAIATNSAGRSSEASYYGTTSALISDDPDPSAVGSPYTVVAAVTSNSVFVPLGTLLVDDGNGASCPITLARVNANSANGSCQMPSELPVGSRTLSLDYAAEQGPFAGSSASGEHSIFQILATTTSIVSIVPTTTVVGQPYTVSVSVNSSGEPVSQGSVSVRQLSDGATCVIQLGPPEGLTGCQLVAHSALMTATRATYSGAANYSTSQSASVSHLVNRADTAIVITGDGPDPSVVNQPVIVEVALGVLAPGAGNPTGTILVSDGTASCGIGLPNLSCTLLPKALGAATIEARYLGDANFNESVDTEAHTITVDGADLSIIKRNGGRLLPGGGSTTYTLLVSNAGPQAVVNARVNDILPTQLSNASWTCVASGGASCPASGVGTVDTLVTLASGSSLSFALTATVQLNPEQVVTNRATVTPPANAPDPDLANNESIDTDSIGVFGDGFESENE